VTTPVDTPADTPSDSLGDTPAAHSRRPGLVFAGGIFALCTAWFAVLPAFSGPDEPSNFIKAAALIRGEFVGTPIPADPTHVMWSSYVDIDERFGTAQQAPYCFIGKASVPASCAEPMERLPIVEPTRTQMGRYPPLGFLPASLGTLVGPSDAGALAARITSAIACCALFALAAWLLARNARSLAPLLVAATPGVVFLFSVDSPSGVEIAAALTAWTALWCAVADSWQRSDNAIVFVVAGSVLVLARPAGMLNIALMFAAAAIADHRAVLAALRCHARSLAVLGGAVATSLAWYLTVYDANFGVRFELDYRVTEFDVILRRTIIDLPRHFGDSVGNFGWLDTPSPTLVVWAFVALTAAFAWRGLDGAGARRQLAVALAIVSVPVWAVALNANYQDLMGTFGVQGRHLTPFIVGVPLAAVMRRAPRASDGAVATVVVLAHLWCVLVAMRRYVRGTSDDSWFNFLHFPIWTPPLGIVGTLVVVAFAHAAAWFAFVHGTSRFADGVGALADDVGRMER
jgi:hypothetical protein